MYNGFMESTTGVCAQLEHAHRLDLRMKNGKYSLSTAQQRSRHALSKVFTINVPF